jgi:outer membrane protein OmpA-like peptidoglycan-associated protein
MVIELEPVEELAEKTKEEEPVKADDQQIRPSEKIIEPAETDQILEVLNKDAATEPGETVAEAAVTASTRLETSVPFGHNEYELNMAAMLEVEKIAELMQSYPETTVRLTGHADATGSSDYNMLLSHQRVDQVAGYLEVRGIDPGRIFREGRGDTSPVARNSYPDGTDAPLGRYLNRQVTVLITSPEPIRAELAGFYVPASLKPQPGEDNKAASAFWFTIQLQASHRQVGLSHFQGIAGVKENHCRDGYYRYTCGSFRTYPEARAELDRLQDSGYPDAFIQTLEWYQRAVIPEDRDR